MLTPTVRNFLETTCPCIAGARPGQPPADRTGLREQAGQQAVREGAHLLSPSQRDVHMTLRCQREGGGNLGVFRAVSSFFLSSAMNWVYFLLQGLLWEHKLSPTER